MQQFPTLPFEETGRIIWAQFFSKRLLSQAFYRDPSFFGGTKLAAALQIIDEIFSFVLLTVERRSKMRRMQRCSDAATYKSLQTMSDTSH